MTTEPAKPRNHVLLYMLPIDVLRQLSEHARRLQREEKVRRYVLSHLWFVLLIVMVIVLFATLAAWVVAMLVAGALSLSGVKAMPAYVAALVFLLPAFIAFIAVTVVLLNNLFAWVEDRAASNM